MHRLLRANRPKPVRRSTAQAYINQDRPQVRNRTIEGAQFVFDFTTHLMSPFKHATFRHGSLLKQTKPHRLFSRLMLRQHFEERHATDGAEQEILWPPGMIN